MMTSIKKMPCPAFKMRKLLLAGSFIAAMPMMVSIANATPAPTHTVVISNIVGTWENATPTGNATYAANGTADPTARWGAPTDPTKSGYNFLAANTISTIVPPSPTPQFTLGTFQHLNEPITAGTSITGIELLIGAKVSIDGGPTQSLNFLFDFTHDETTNNFDPNCPYGVGTGINVNGCADKVTVNYNSLSDSFLIGTDQYTLSLTGFEVGGVPQTSFLTEEDALNSASLLGTIELRSAAVPEPMALAVLGSGLIGLGVARRKYTV
jgi:hypothetical protein